MSGKAKLSLDEIIDATLALIRQSGWEGVSARSLARALTTSTMPIYSIIGSMEVLRKQARFKALSLLEGFQGRRWVGDALMDKAFGYIHFAKEEGRIFRFIFEAAGDASVSMDAVKLETSRKAEGSQDFTAAFGSMPREGVVSIGFHSWLYVHGLACLLADGLLDLGDDELLRCLETVGGALFSFISQNGG